MKATPALVALAAAGVEHSVHTYEPPTDHRDYGLVAAAAVGVEPARMAKTLVVEADGRLVLGVVPVSGTLDLKALAAAVGSKRAAMADAAKAERATGYVTGGISPLGTRQRLGVVVDASLTAFETVVVSGGLRGLSVELAPGDLVATASAAVAAIAGPPTGSR